MRFWRTDDVDLIKNIMTHPRVYRHISDDGSPSVEEFLPQINDLVLYFAIGDASGKAVGIFMTYPHNTICYEVHTCMTPDAWGEIARQGAHDGCEWMFTNTRCQRIITNVPSYNRLAARFSVDCGMTLFGVNKKSILKNGMLYDQAMYGISKEDWLCQQQSH